MQTEKNLHFYDIHESKLKFNLVGKKTKKSKSPFNKNHSNNNEEEDNNNNNNGDNTNHNSNHNFEDNNYISHPIQIKKEEQDDTLCFYVKSTKVVSQRQFSLLKEVDRDNTKTISREVKSAKKAYKSSKKKKKKMKNYTDKPDKFKLTDKKTSKEISDFYASP